MRDRPAGRHGSVHPLRFAALRSGEARPTPEDCGTCNLRATQGSDALFASRTTTHDTLFHHLSYALLFHSKSIHGIHPRLSLPPLAVNRAVFPLGHRSRESHRCSSCNNTTTELGGKSLALSLSFPPAFNRFVVEGRL